MQLYALIIPSHLSLSLQVRVEADNVEQPTDQYTPYHAFGMKMAIDLL